VLSGAGLRYCMTEGSVRLLLRFYSLSKAVSEVFQLFFGHARRHAQLTRTLAIYLGTLAILKLQFEQY
jgi:hypothetical protein